MSPAKTKIKGDKVTFTKEENAYKEEVLQYAWDISKDEQFLCTILGENGELTFQRKHNYEHQLCWDWKSWENKKAPYQVYAQKKCEEGAEGYFWRTHTDWGFGISDGYHKKVVDDERFMTDWKWNLDQTYKLWNGGTTFYGKSRCWDTLGWFKINEVTL